VNDSGETRHTRVHAMLKELGFKKVGSSAEGVRFRMPPQKERLDLEVVVAPEAKNPQPTEKFDDPRFDALLYVGHARYGQTMEDMLSRPLKGVGANKLFIMCQCTGTSGVEPLRNKMPRVQMISTSDWGNMNIYPVMLQRVFAGIRDEKKWTEVEPEV